MSRLGDYVKNKLRDWLEFQEANPNTVIIQESATFRSSAQRNLIWYRGDADELHQLYTQINGGYTGGSRFWAAAPAGQSIRKMHTGLPALIVDTLAYIIKSDMGEIEFGEDGNGAGAEEWREISKTIKFENLIANAVAQALASGDGAFKLSIDPAASKYPIVEFYSADRVEFIRNRGMCIGVDFITVFSKEKKQYKLVERYRYAQSVQGDGGADAPGAVTYKLYDGDNEVSISKLPQLKGLTDTTFDGNHPMAIPLIFYDNPKCPGRGRSIFETKTDNFDAHDEVVSQWMDALRAGRVTKYIPRDMIPTNPETLELLPVNAFGDTVIQVDTIPGSNGAQAQKIQVEQPDIMYEAFLWTYNTTLDLCLQGIISPATLGIDVGKMASADAQREKKDITGSTRNAITAVLETVIPELVNAILSAYENMQGRGHTEYSPSVSFGEYGAPDFDSRVETITRAATAGVMSINAYVDELWGNSKAQKWKDEEVERIMNERGMMTAPEPAVGVDLP